jgi:hypothetical protein
MMSSQTVIVENLPLSNDQINREHPEVLSQGLPERPPNWSGDANNYRPISHLDAARQEFFSDGDSIARSNFLEPQIFAPEASPAYHSNINSETHRVGQENRHYSSEDCLATLHSLQITQRPFHTSPIDQNSQLAHHFTDPKKVPGTDLNIYPRAPNRLELQDRYVQLVDLFKKAVDTHKFLKHHTSSINYELRLCGKSPSDAVASIVIFCTVAIFKQLRSLLTSRHIRRQYQLEKPSVQNRFAFASQKSQVPIPSMVPFKVVFWRETTTPTQRRSAMEQVVTESHSFLTMCGSLVRYGDRTSTLGLLISMDSKLYGLTVDHLFKGEIEEQSTITEESNALYEEYDADGNTECDHEDEEADQSWIDDVNYQDLGNDPKLSVNEISISGVTYDEVVIDQELSEDHSVPIKGHKLDCINTVGLSTPYLDWALVDFDAGHFERPNAFYSDDSLTPKFLTQFSAMRTTDIIPVFMISGVSGTQKGMMHNSNSYIGGKPGESLCQTWNVILSDSAGKMYTIEESPSAHAIF